MNCVRVFFLLAVCAVFSSCDFKKDRNNTPKPPPAPAPRQVEIKPKKQPEVEKEKQVVNEPAVVEWEGGDFSVSKSFKEADLILVMLYADWCPHCKVFTPLLEGMTKREDKKIRVLKINADTFPDIAQQYKVVGVPKVLIFRQGNQVGEFVGSITEDKLNIIVRNVSSDGLEPS